MVALLQQSRKHLFTATVVLVMSLLSGLKANADPVEKLSQTGRRSTARFKIVEFLDDDFGWAARDHSLWKTEDGGTSWVHIRHSQTSVMREVSGLRRSQTFIDRIQPLSREDGWILEDGSLLHTTDGGQHWSKFERDKLDIRSFRFLDVRDGFFIGQRLHYGNKVNFWREAQIYRSNDGGKNWRRVRLRKRLKWTWLFDLWAASRDNIWVVGDLFLNSRDGGKSWKEIKINTGNGFYGRATHVEFVDANRGWIAANYGFAITNNGGHTWARTSSNRRAKNLIRETRGHPWRRDG